MQMQNVNKGPVARFKCGRFQVSLWQSRNGPRACVQYSTFDRLHHKWENLSIWCDSHELRDLAGVLDQLNE